MKGGGELADTELLVAVKEKKPPFRLMHKEHRVGGAFPPYLLMENQTAGYKMAVHQPDPPGSDYQIQAWRYRSPYS
jgi:hypothetical protein